MLRDLIKSRNFKEAIQLVNIPLTQKTMDSMFSWAYEDDDIVYYDFLKFFLDNNDETALLHYQIAEFISTALNHLPNGYKIAFEHAERAYQLDPNNVSYHEFLLLFNTIPERLLDHERANKIAQRILEIDPNNKAARLVTGTL